MTKKLIRNEKEAIKTLKSNMRTDDTLKKALELAIKALEKQVPKKPTFEGDSYDTEGNIVCDTWICPRCERDYEVDYDEYDYCPVCGQAIEWR